MKPKLLVIELWGVGDLTIATPFLRAAAERFEVTLLAKPYAADVQQRFWPGVRTIPFVAPWTAFHGKYRLHQWPWLKMIRLWRRLRRERFDVGLSARWDPRDHLLLFGAGIRERLGYPRAGSRMFLTRPLVRPEPEAHRYEHWRTLGLALGFEPPEREQIAMPPARRSGNILVHTGAGQPVRVWPLDRYQHLVQHLRRRGLTVQVACDEPQRAWWLSAGEKNVVAPQTITELFALIDRAGLFIGNDSGPGHLAAFCGVPTFTLFGPQLPEWFAPLHPAAEWIEGDACPYKPCFDYCRFPVPHCLYNVTEDAVRARVDRFVDANFGNANVAPRLPEQIG